MDATDLAEKIRKILRKTEEAGCTPEEAEAAFAKASSLAAQYNLDLAAIESDSASAGDAIDWMEDTAAEHARWGLENTLAMRICERFFFVEAFVMRGNSGGKLRSQAMFFGKPSNVETAVFVYNALLAAFGRLFADHRKATGCAARERRLFTSGVASGFTAKLDDRRKAEAAERDMLRKQDSPGTAIVLANIQKDTHDAFWKKHPDVRMGRSYAAPSGSRSTFDAGVVAGRGLELNHPIAGPGRKGLPGR